MDLLDAANLADEPVENESAADIWVIIIIIFFYTLGIKDPEGFGNRKIRNWKCKEWHLIRAVIMDKRIVE